jgi:hypothetical protein
MNDLLGCISHCVSVKERVNIMVASHTTGSSLVVNIQLRFLLQREKKKIRVHNTELPIEPVYRTNRHYANNMKLKNKKCDEKQNYFYYGRYNVYLAVDFKC